ncbi:MAG TPA: hypothetical protein VEC15_08790 [Actinomycetota bacterium]|nr:hypothetical protein [Actinomycetota bacterium]
MTHHPFDADELDRADATLSSVASRLEAFAEREGGVPPTDLASRIRDRIAAEPVPFASAWLRRFSRSRSWMAAFAATTAAVVVVVGIVAFSQIAGLVRDFEPGSTPIPSVSPSPSPSPTPTPTPTPTPPLTDSPSPSSSSSESPEASETPEPSEDDDDDNSGRGGGGDDNSGPGGGGDDNSGPGS